MATSKIEKALQLIADHFASDEANYRNRETGEALKATLGTSDKPAEDDAADENESDKSE